MLNVGGSTIGDVVEGRSLDVLLAFFDHFFDVALKKEQTGRIALTHLYIINPQHSHQLEHTLITNAASAMIGPMRKSQGQTRKDRSRHISSGRNGCL